MPRENKLGVEGHRAFPQAMNAACAVAADTKNTTLPPTLSAARRSPRRQAVIAASSTKITSANTLNWPTSNHGFATPCAIEETVSSKEGNWPRLGILR